MTKIPPVALLLLLLDPGFCLAGEPVETAMSPAQFLEPYQAALNAIEGKETVIGEAELVHLGLAQSDAIKFWYSLADGAPATGPIEILARPHLSGQPYAAMSDVRHTRNGTHRTGTIVAPGLTPGTQYDFLLRGGGLRREHEVLASTAPVGKPAFSFLAASCFLPWNYSRKKETYIANETTTILRALQDRTNAPLQGSGRPAFYLGLGDQLYVDPGADDDARIAYLHGKNSELLRGTLADTPKVLRNLYRYQFALRPFDRALSNIPSAMMWDDHDIRDGWGSQDDETSKGWTNYYRSAREAFLSFQASRNPNFQPAGDVGTWDLGTSGQIPRDEAHRPTGEVDFQFDWAAASFFVSDGRSARDWSKRTGMSADQITRVKVWLGTLSKRSDESLVYVFCYPVPLLGGRAMLGKLGASLPSSGQDDAAERAYVNAKERSDLLDALLGHARQNPKHRLLVISGDVHYSSLQIARDEKDNRILAYEVTTSGLAQTAFNDQGPYWLTVARSASGARLEDRGFYAGPCFVEFFIGEPQPGGPPEVKVLFYPGAQRKSALNSSRLKTYSALSLNVMGVDARFAEKPEDYPPNTLRWLIWPFRRTTISHLAEHIILDQWIASGRAVSTGDPWAPAAGWE